MNRTEALAKLNNGEARYSCQSDILVRSSLRQIALTFGVNYYEEKGWLSSFFIFRGSAHNVLSLKNYLEVEENQYD